MVQILLNMVLNFFSVRGVILILSFLKSHLFYQATSDVYIDDSKGLKRDTEKGVAYANFAAHKFRRLNITPLESNFVKETGECARLCVDHSSCFSTNLSPFRDGNGYLLCELLPSDKYNHSTMFIDSVKFHHLSIKVSPKASTRIL